MSTSKRILIVEDEALISLDIQTTLEDLGHQTVAASSNAAAAAALAAGSFDLAILDYNVLDGQTDSLASLLQHSRTPFLVCSGTAGISELSEGFQNTTFLAKPFTTARLVEVVSAIPVRPEQ